MGGLLANVSYIHSSDPRQNLRFLEEDTFNVHLRKAMALVREIFRRKNGVTLTQPLIRQLQLMTPREPFLLVITNKIMRSTFILLDDRQFASRGRKEEDAKKSKGMSKNVGARERKKKNIVALVTKVTEEFSDWSCLARFLSFEISSRGQISSYLTTYLFSLSTYSLERYSPNSVTSLLVRGEKLPYKLEEARVQ